MQSPTTNLCCFLCFKTTCFITIMWFFMSTSSVTLFHSNVFHYNHVVLYIKVKCYFISQSRVKLHVQSCCSLFHRKVFIYVFHYNHVVIYFKEKRYFIAQPCVSLQSYGSLFPRNVLHYSTAMCFITITWLKCYFISCLHVSLQSRSLFQSKMLFYFTASCFIT